MQTKRRTFRKKFNSHSSNSFRRKSGGRFQKKSRAIATFNPQQFINKNPQEVTQEVFTPTHTFKDFDFAEQINKNLHFNSLITPSPIQDQSIPHILANKDIVGLAQTGTGKTAAFLLPLIQKNVEHNKKYTTLILTPTRELAIQIQDECTRLGRGLGMQSVCCVGGVPIRPQIIALKKDVPFIIGTPGRIMDLIDRKVIHPNKFKAVVLDEADRMLDMGFIHDMRSILGATSQDRHTIFFSATMPESAKKLVAEFLQDPVHISVKKKDVTNSIAQDIVVYQKDSKFDTLVTLLNTPSCSRAIIFGAMKRSVSQLAKDLMNAGIIADSIHGDKTHHQRQQALRRFKSGATKVLVATDVAARGIHVDNVSHVINYDLPNCFEDYVHRIGRTGRGSKKGQAITFVEKTTVEARR